jgi:hypothetical protein
VQQQSQAALYKGCFDCSLKALACALDLSRVWKEEAIKEASSKQFVKPRNIEGAAIKAKGELSMRGSKDKVRRTEVVPSGWIGLHRAKRRRFSLA